MVIRSQEVEFLEDRTIEDIEMPRMSSNTSANGNPDPAPAQLATDKVHEEIPEAEPEEADKDVEQGETQSVPSEITEESVEQGEPQPTPLEATRSFTEMDDDRPPETSGPQTIRSERGRIPSTRYPGSEYILLTDVGEPESFPKARRY